MKILKKRGTGVKRRKDNGSSFKREDIQYIYRQVHLRRNSLGIGSSLNLQNAASFQLHFIKEI